VEYGTNKADKKCIRFHIFSTGPVYIVKVYVLDIIVSGPNFTVFVCRAGSFHLEDIAAEKKFGMLKRDIKKI
jgi:hypothetical protein